MQPWLNFIEEREERLQHAESIEVDAKNQVEFQSVYGICAQAIRYAGAYVVLYRAGRLREGVAVARQALEHALTAQWAHFTESGPDQLINSYHHSRERMFREVTKNLTALQSEVDEALNATTHAGAPLLRVSDRISAVDFDDMFKAEYMRQSQIVHVTSETVTAFLGLDEDQAFILKSDATDSDATKTAYFTAMAAMFASWVIESLTIGTPCMAELERLSDELLLPLSIESETTRAETS
ncbi:hypothetical protein [Clavibacter michiganensis]|uniref:hypothetical protein n=1 Tax=Clavibacter michiganensis TaxID=28447 RepID=UPI00307A73BD